MGGKKKKTTIGFRYFMGLFMGLCRGPVDAIRQIRVGDKVAWTGKVSSNASITIDQPNLFGGEEQEGGIQGTLQVMLGAPDQPRNDNLAAMLGGLVSAFRGVTTTFFDGQVCAMSPYPKEWSYLVQKTKAGWHNGECWYPAACEIDLGEIREPIAGSWPWVHRTSLFVVGGLHEYTGSYTGYQGWWKGWIKSFRVTAGVARHARTEYAVPEGDFSAATDPYWDNVVLQLRMQGEHGSSAFVDDKGHTVTLLGAPHIDTSKPLFGGPSAYFNGSSDALLVDMGGDADLGSVWTVDAWVWLSDVSTGAYSFGLFGHGVHSIPSRDTRWELLKSMNWAYQQSTAVNLFEPAFAQNIGPYSTAGRWMFVSLCFDGDRYWMHVDGKLVTGASAGAAMNPAHILRRLYTDPRIGRGLDPSTRFDEASWIAAADAFYAEGMGLCLKWSRTSPISDFAAEVINHAGAAIYTSRRTGKLVLKAIRDDYDVDDLPLFSPDSGLLGFDDDESTAQSTANEVVVKWFDPLEKVDKAVREKNLGAIMAAGGITKSAEVDYPGIPTEALARRIARRDLAAKGCIKRLSVRLDRRGRDIMPGHVFRISDPSRGIVTMVLRAGRVEFGTITDGTITVTAVLDVFGLPATIYRPPTETGYSPPDATPTAPALQRVMEAPYRELVQVMGAADLAAMPADAGYLTAMAVSPSGMADSFALITRVTPANFRSVADLGSWCPGGILSVGLSPSSTEAVLTEAADLAQIEVGAAAVIGDEIVRIDAVNLSTSTLTIARGCVDTVPATHAAGTAVLCYDTWGADDPSEYVAGINVEAKLLTRTSSGVLDASMAPVQLISLGSRAARPYPPGALRVGGDRYPVSRIGALELTWAHRDRVTQADHLIDVEAASIGPESGTTYTVRAYINGLLADEQTGITGASATVDLIAGSGLCKVDVWAVRDGLESWKAATASFSYKPTAFTPYADQSGTYYVDQDGTTYEG